MSKLAARPVVLASTSRYRRGLMERLGIPFEVEAPTFDESTCDSLFPTMIDGEFALHLARNKAQSVAAMPAWAGAWILAADQIAVHPGPPRTLLHKPGTSEKAVEQLISLSGRTHSLVTGVVLHDAIRGAQYTAIDDQRLTMRSFSRAEAQTYVDRYQPLDCVGSYRIEDAGIRLFESIDGGDYTGIIGLPLIAVCGLLRTHGLFESS